MKDGALLGLGLLGAFLLGATGKASAAASVSNLPGPEPLPTPKPTPKPKPQPGPKIGPATIIRDDVPAGWIAAYPSPEIKSTAMSIASLGDPVGTRYPFTLGNKKYLAMVVTSPSSPGGKAVAVLQPEDQT